MITLSMDVVVGFRKDRLKSMLTNAFSFMGLEIEGKVGSVITLVIVVVTSSVSRC